MTVTVLDRARLHTAADVHHGTAVPTLGSFVRWCRGWSLGGEHEEQSTDAL
ncbi:MAG TPA: hypothetical protein VNF47_17505 [Streptosporangiaceae bacterium]|nr:hypothetical protein [Streptosporangiaceae bacterium]